MDQKMSSLIINDIFEELSEENSRLLNELLLAKKCLNKLIELKVKLNFHSNKIKTTLEPNDWQSMEEIIQEFDEMVNRKDTIVTRICDSLKTKLTEKIIKCSNCEKINFLIIDKTNINDITNTEINEMQPKEETFNNNLSIKVEESEEETQEDIEVIWAGLVNGSFSTVIVSI